MSMHRGFQVLNVIMLMSPRKGKHWDIWLKFRVKMKSLCYWLGGGGGGGNSLFVHQKSSM